MQCITKSIKSTMEMYQSFVNSNSIKMFLLFLLSLVFQVATARQRFIVGGNEVTNPDRWQWMGSLKASGQHTCGCVLVHESWVLTSAHCLSGNEYTIEFGTIEINNGTLYDIENAAIHPDYDDDSTLYDIAVLESTQIEGAHIAPIDLTVDADIVGSTNCWVTGWGRLDGGEELPTTLHEVNMPIPSAAVCEAWLGDAYFPIYQICGYDNELQDKAHCDGDRGGPLMCMQEDGIWRLEGIASWHMSNCSPAMPSIYTRIEAMKKFICDTTIGVVAPENCTPITGPTPPTPPTDPPKKA